MVHPSNSTNGNTGTDQTASLGDAGASGSDAQTAVDGFTISEASGPAAGSQAGEQADDDEEELLIDPPVVWNAQWLKAIGAKDGTEADKLVDTGHTSPWHTHITEALFRCSKEAGPAGGGAHCSRHEAAETCDARVAHDLCRAGRVL